MGADLQATDIAERQTPLFRSAVGGWALVVLLPMCAVVTAIIPAWLSFPLAVAATVGWCRWIEGHPQP
jgi:hypothetical protein